MPMGGSATMLGTSQTLLQENDKNECVGFEVISKKANETCAGAPCNLFGAYSHNAP